MNYFSHNHHFAFVRYLLSLLVSTTLFVSTYVYIFSPNGLRRPDTIFVINDAQDPRIREKNTNRGLRTAKINVDYNLPKDLTVDEVYDDVKLMSTSRRPFKPEERAIIKLVLDQLPEKLYTYRPWGIISSPFDDNIISNINPQGVAFASGPYMYVGDVTFRKSQSFDTGTFRGLQRILSHEVVHNAQFFETRTYPASYSASILENSDIVKEWVKSTGWSKSGNSWVLGKDEKTTDYGATNPVEDMADSIGSMIIGEEYSLSANRVAWSLQWVNQDKTDLFMATLPLSATTKQRKVESSDNKLLAKYADSRALTQDVLNFQSTEKITRRDYANYYASEFKKRGWNGSINTAGAGTFEYANIYKVNIEMDDNPLRVATLVLSTFQSAQ